MPAAAPGRSRPATRRVRRLRGAAGGRGIAALLLLGSLVGAQPVAEAEFEPGRAGRSAPRAAALQDAPAGAESWRVDGGEVRVRCRLTVGGSFDAVTTSLSGALRRETPDGRSWAATLRVDLATLDTGIELRDAHLRDRYLEIDRGPDFRHAELSAVVLAETPPAGGGRRETRFSGTLALHGVARTVEGRAEIRSQDGRMRVTARFPLRLEAFAIPPPRHLGIGVRDEVAVTVAFDALPGAPPAAGFR